MSVYTCIYIYIIYQRREKINNNMEDFTGANAVVVVVVAAV